MATGSTKMAGPIEEMNCEQVYFETLNGITNFEIKEGELTLSNTAPTEKNKPQTMLFKRI